jgi:CMP-N-acetylneuraminic acid synthetase
VTALELAGRRQAHDPSSDHEKIRGLHGAILAIWVWYHAFLAPKPLVFALITARGGSKGLPGKNLRPLRGKSLVAWSVAAARACRSLDETWVSTDDLAIARAATKAGGIVPFLRPKRLAGDEASIFEVLKHGVAEYINARGKVPDIVVLLQASSPLRRASDITKTVNAVKNGADSAQTVCLDEAHPLHKYFLKNGRMIPVLPETKRSSRRQDDPKVYRPNGAVYAARTEVLFKTGTLHGKDHRAVIMDFESSVDIDTIWDFKLAEAIAAKSR